MAVAANDWLDIIHREYLRRFIPEGGAAVKFVTGDDDVLREVRLRLKELAGEARLDWVEIDSAATRLHMIQDVFFAIARQIDWDGLAQRWVEQAFRQHRYDWPRASEAVPIQELADANDLDPLMMKREVRQWLTAGIARDHEMGQDFRSAMIQLCLRRMEFEDTRAVAPVIEWLRGDLRAIAAVRDVPIAARITRHNGRAMLKSLCHWLKRSGGAGLVVALDLRHIAFAGRGGEGIRRYTPAAVLDVFEVLRQVIDDAENLGGLFLAVLAGPDFVEGDPKRGVSAYQALKERIWSDVHARGHENPLTPLLRLEVGGASSTTRPGDMTFSEERVAIEALRSGVPNRSAIRLLGTGEEKLGSRFAAKLRECRDGAALGHLTEGEIVAGGFGSGKSHLLGTLADQALRENFIVSPVAISKETPLFDPERVFGSAIRNAVVPEINDDVMTAVLNRLHPRTAAYEELDAWASSPAADLSPLFAALLFLIPKQVTTSDDVATIGRFLGGAKLNVAKVRQWLRAAGAAKMFDLKPVRAGELALQRLRFAPRLFRAAGFAGWCVLLDEVELIGRYSTLQRGKSYAELCRWLGLAPDVGVQGVISVAAITDDFKAAILEGRLDQEKVPRVLAAKGLDRSARLAEIAMAAIDKRQHALAVPDEARLRGGVEKVGDLYRQAYGWTSPAIGIGERRAGGTMRQYIKAWITEWDIHRLLGEKTDIDVEATATDYSENADLERAPVADEQPADED